MAVPHNINPVPQLQSAPVRASWKIFRPGIAALNDATPILA
jgi:hypothetical protein